MTTTSPSASPNILAQGDGDTISCRITVDDEIKDERTPYGRECRNLLLGEVGMSAPVDDTPTDAMPAARHSARPRIPRFIRTFAVPIILVWIAIIAVLNTVVPQLEEVGKLRAVSMSPNDAPSLIATKRVGEVFKEYNTSSSVMIVLEGEEPLGRRRASLLRRDRPEAASADTTHVQHVQDFWGDSFTAAGAQSVDGKAAYVQVYIAGDQGETIANESVEAVRHIAADTPAPAGVKAYVAGPAATSTDQNEVGDESMKMIELVTFGVIIIMLLLVYRSIITTLIVIVMVVLGLLRRSRHRGVPRLPRRLRSDHVRDEHVGHLGHRRGHRLRDLPDRSISGGPQAW